MNLKWLLRWAVVLAPALMLTAGAGGPALADCNCTPPPVCCKPPTPPSPPSQPCCGSGGHQINIPGVRVQVAPTIIVNAGVNAVVNANASASAQATGVGQQYLFVVGGGGSSFAIGSGSSSVIPALNVESGARSEAIQSRRTRVRIIVVQASCLDDKLTPHPASQVTPDRDIGEDYEGELYRCIAGTHMQITFADFKGQVAFEHAETMSCQKNEALYYTGPAAAGPDGPNAGRMECRPQKPARDCNERSLLRRYGAGVKVIKIVTTETFTATREEHSESSASGSIALDGGVGGVAY